MVSNLEEIQGILEDILNYSRHMGLYTIYELADEALGLVKQEIDGAQNNSK